MRLSCRLWQQASKTKGPNLTSAPWALSNDWIFNVEECIVKCASLWSVQHKKADRHWEFETSTSLRLVSVNMNPIYSLSELARLKTLALSILVFFFFCKAKRFLSKIQSSNAQKVESNHWAVRLLQIWSLHTTPVMLIHALVETILDGTRTRNLRLRRPTPYPLGHEDFCDWLRQDLNLHRCALRLARLCSWRLQSAPQISDKVKGDSWCWEFGEVCKRVEAHLETAEATGTRYILVELLSLYSWVHEILGTVTIDVRQLPLSAKRKW